VIAGNDKGKEGRVLEIFPDEEKAIVEGVNIQTKHVRPSEDNPSGGVNNVEGPVHISNLMVIDPAEGEPTRVGRKEKDGKYVRYAKKSGKTFE
jgi:large subunit ribosomal protein L24